jgi:hypothetical protein
MIFEDFPATVFERNKILEIFFDFHVLYLFTRGLEASNCEYPLRRMISSTPNVEDILRSLSMSRHTTKLGEISGWHHLNNPRVDQWWSLVDSTESCL